MKSLRHQCAGLARMKGLTPSQRKALARSGGQAAQRLGVGHRWTAEEARHMGRIAGLSSGIARLTPAQIELRIDAAYMAMQEARRRGQCRTLETCTDDNT